MIKCKDCGGAGAIDVPDELATLEAYYFGCWDDSGHYWHTSPLKQYLPGRKIDERVPLQLRRGKIDSRFCPGVVDGENYKSRSEAVGEGRLTHVEGWTVLGWWDRSIDSRPGSNSNIVAMGTWDYTVMIAIADAQFPTILSRQRTPIVLVEEDGKLC